MIKQLRQDKRYTIQDRENSTWLDVNKDGKMIALVMSEETARQVIYRDIIENGSTCNYLNDDDF